MKLRKFLLVTTNLVTISTITAVSCTAPQPQKRQFTIQNVSEITVTQTSAEFTAKITGLQGNDQLNVKINDTVHNFTVSSLNKPADNQYKITISGLTKGTTYLLDTIKVNNDTLFNVKRPFTTLNDVVATNPPIENREQDEPVNPNPPREENEPLNPGTSDPAPKDPTNGNGTQESSREENTPSNTGASDPNPKDQVNENPSTPGGDNNQNPGNTTPNPPNDSAQPGQDPTLNDSTTEQGNGNGNQESPKTEPNPTPTPKQPDEEKLNNGTNNPEKVDEQQTTPTTDAETGKQKNNEELTSPDNGRTQTDVDSSEKAPADVSDNADSTNTENDSKQDETNNENNGTNGTNTGNTDQQTIDTQPTEEKPLKFDSVTVEIDSSNKNYILFKIVADKDIYQKVKDKLFKYELRAENNTYADDTTNGSNRKTWVDSQTADKITFKVAPFYPWNTGTYTLTSLWDNSDSKKQNLLTGTYKFKFTKGEKVEMINS